MPRPKLKFKKGKFTTSAVGPAWHPDGTPFTQEDYKAVGMIVPTKEQIQRWLDREYQFMVDNWDKVGPEARISPALKRLIRADAKKQT